MQNVQADSTADFITTEREYDDNRDPILDRSGEATEGRQPNNVVRIEYDERRLVFRVIGAPGDADQSTTQYDYDATGNVIASRQGLEDASNIRVTTRSLDGYDRVVTTTDPMGNVLTLTYDANSNAISARLDGELDDVTGSAGNVRLAEVTHTYDDMDRPTERAADFFDPATQVPSNYTPSNDFKDWTHVWMLHQRTNDNGHALTYTHDTANRLETVTDATGNSRRFTYNAKSLVTAITDTDKSDLGNPDQTFTTTLDYDNVDRLVRVTDNVLNFNTLSFDSRNSPVVAVDARNNEVRFAYDGISRLIKTIRDMNGDGADPTALPGDAGPDIVTTRSYDDNSRVVGRTDDNGNTAGTSYDAPNRPTGQLHADTTAHIRSYDVHHNPVTMIDANGTVVICTYDLNSRLTNKTIAVGPGVSDATTFETYNHDGQGRRVSAADDNSTVLLAYDSLSNCTAETLNGQTTASVYDGVGNLVTCTYPGGRTISRTYDELERASTVTDTTAVPIGLGDFFYVGPDRIERRDLGNGTRTDYTYNGMTGVPNSTGDFGVKQVIRIKHSVIVGSAIIDDRTYKWDPTGNKIERVDIRAGGPELNHDYHYDAIFRMARSVVTDAGGGAVDDTVYNCDGVNNRIQVTGGLFSGPYTQDSNITGAADKQVNQYTSTPTDVRLYDDNGNPTLMDRGGGETNQLRFDFRNRLVEVQTNNALGTIGTTNFFYDALGRTIGKFGDSGEIRYFYNGRVQIEEQDEIGTTRASYVYGAALQRYGVRAESGGSGAGRVNQIMTMNRDGNNFGYHCDDLGNVMALSDAAGATVCRYAYNDYGTPSFFDGGGNPLAASAVDNPFLFNARRYHPETGWYDYGRRFFEPPTGRYLTRHPGDAWPAHAGRIGNVKYSYSVDGFGYEKPSSWTGTRRAPGELQLALSDLSDIGNAYTFRGNNPWSNSHTSGGGTGGGRARILGGIPGSVGQFPTAVAVVDTGYSFDHPDASKSNLLSTPRIHYARNAVVGITNLPVGGDLLNLTDMPVSGEVFAPTPFGGQEGEEITFLILYLTPVRKFGIC